MYVELDAQLITHKIKDIEYSGTFKAISVRIGWMDWMGSISDHYYHQGTASGAYRGFGLTNSPLQPPSMSKI